MQVNMLATRTDGAAWYCEGKVYTLPLALALMWVDLMWCVAYP